MQVVLHAGAHMTDEDRLITCLQKNADLLAQAGTAVPRPNNYRKAIRVLLRAAARTELTEDARDKIMDATSLDTEPDRLVLSGPSFFGTPKMVVGSQTFYASAQARMGYFHNIFPHDRLELFMGIRNPATFLPAVYEIAGEPSIPDFLGGCEPTMLRWSELIQRLRDAFPDLPITVWCNEDTPLIWSEILREMAGLDPTTELEGEFALLEEIMTAPGMKRFKSYLASHPAMSETQKRRVIAAFLDKFADDEAIEEELDVPGWTDELIDQLTENYDDDILAIGRIPGVNLIAP